jgi:hypothetical protein
MADERLRELSGTVVSGDLSALLDTLYLAVDAASFTDAKKVLLKSILTESIVTNPVNNYQAMTPKSFYNSVMTTSRNGVNRISTNEEVTAKSTGTVLLADQQGLMQTQWLIDWFTKNGAPVITHKNDIVPDAIAFDATYAQAAFAVGAYALLNATLPTAKRFDGIYCTLSAAAGTQKWRGTYSLDFTGAEVVVSIMALGALSLTLSADGKSLQIKNTYAAAYDVKISIHVNAVLANV